MTLSQIIAQALRQLDEDAEDVSEYEERFRVYANMGYDIAVREYLKPRRIFYTEVDEEGNAPVPGLTVVRVIELRDKNGFDIGFDLDPCGRCFRVWRDDLAGQTLRIVRPGVVNHGLVDVLITAEYLVVRGKHDLIVAVLRHGHEQPRL